MGTLHTRKARRFDEVDSTGELQERAEVRHNPEQGRSCPSTRQRFEKNPRRWRHRRHQGDRARATPRTPVPAGHPTVSVASRWCQTPIIHLGFPRSTQPDDSPDSVGHPRRRVCGVTGPPAGLHIGVEDADQPHVVKPALCTEAASPRAERHRLERGTQRGRVDASTFLSEPRQRLDRLLVLADR